MYKIFLPVFLLLTTHLVSQHYITFGIGVEFGYFDSPELSSFNETYNYVNEPSLERQLKGYNGIEGLRWELGYRYIRKLIHGFTGGYQSFQGTDFAKFYNKESRKVELKNSSFFLEPEAGIKIREILLSGFLTFHFKRETKLTSDYLGPIEDIPTKSLNGVYTTESSSSIDIGASVGFIYAIFMFTGRIAYPVYTGGSENQLRDPHPLKIDDGIDVFPDHYVKYLNFEAYEGVRSNIDGFKIILSVSFALKIMD
jgi:hypothetical protein